MDLKEKYSVVKSYSREYGTFLGFSWIVTFAIYVMGLRCSSILLLLLAMFMICLLPLVAFYFSWRLKRHMADLREAIPFRLALMFSLMMFFYACVLTGMAEYIYFAFMDNGAAVQSLYDMFLSEDTQRIYSENGMESMLNMVKDSLDQLGSMSPFSVVMMLFNQNFMVSLILSVVTSLITRRDADPEGLRYS